MPNKITLTLPESVYENYQHKAKTLDTPVVQLIEEVICADQPPPPPVNDAAEDLRADLRALEKLTNRELRHIAESHLAPDKQKKLDRLADKRGMGKLTARERKELDKLLDEGQALTVIKAHAWVLLKWRGEAIPTYEELRERSKNYLGGIIGCLIKSF